MKLTVAHLEPLKARYSEQLKDWELGAFSKKFDQIISVIPKRDDVDQIIHTGKVLDRVNRPVWAMEQIREIIQSPTPDLGKIYFSDFFHPGLEALPYQQRQFQAYTFCWAQSWDVYDFTHPLAHWMRPYEIMAMSIYTHVYVACEQLAELIIAWAPDIASKIKVVGLPFHSGDVGGQRDPGYDTPKYDLVFASRFDKEKQPDFFLDLVESTGVKAAICTGHEKLKGDDFVSVQRAVKMRDQGRLDIHEGVTKGQYYSVLANSHIQVNSSLQDWVSFTLLEALTYGCVPLYPNFRAMPDTLLYNEKNLYRPFDLDDASMKMKRLLDGARNFASRDEVLGYHDQTLNRITKLIHES